MAAYEIRRCTLDDAEAISSLGARLFVEAYGPTHPEPERSRYLAKAYSVAVIAEAIEGEGSSVFVVEDLDGAPLAYAHISSTTEFPPGVDGRRPFEIVRFYVDSAQQGRGIGAMLMNHCCDAARRAGGDVIWLQTWSQASWAIGFYLRLGFEIVGKKPFYFGERVDEDHVMARAL
ncbi:MAG TPA: GNAT family N-acetyltransferase [Gemmatimonadaceae bacterium]|nr:GNAT family N-acetyltransferase [Gemmatimonadaceae bacterium]